MKTNGTENGHIIALFSKYPAGGPLSVRSFSSAAYKCDHPDGTHVLGPPLPRVPAVSSEIPVDSPENRLRRP